VENDEIEAIKAKERNIAVPRMHEARIGKSI